MEYNFYEYTEVYDYIVARMFQSLFLLESIFYNKLQREWAEAEKFQSLFLMEFIFYIFSQIYKYESILLSILIFTGI